MSTTCSKALVFSTAILIFNAHDMFAQDYPSRPLRIVTTAAGGGNDFLARQIAPGMSAALGQPVVVDNRGGSLTVSEIASRAAPDGYTLLVNGSSVWIVPMLQKAPYDPARDFLPVSLIEREFSILAVHPSLGVNSTKELIALAKAKPGILNYGMTNIGGTTHLNMELFKSMAGINIVNVPYKATSAAVTALIAGEVQVMITDIGLMLQQNKTGKVKALAVTSAEPTVLAPGLPTVAASGLPGYQASGMIGVFVPAKTPPAVVNRLNQEIVRVLSKADVKERIFAAGVEPAGTSAEEFAAVIKSDAAQWEKVIKQAGIKAN